MFSKSIVVLTIAFLLEITPVLSNPSYTCDAPPLPTYAPPTTCQAPTSCIACPTCQNFTAVPYDINLDLIASPYFVKSMKEDSISQNVDSQCYTFIQLVPGVFMSFQTTTRKDGSFYVGVFFKKNGPQGTGSFEFVGLGGPNVTGALVIYSYALASFCEGCSPTTAAYNDVLAQDCYQVGDYNNPLITFTTTLTSDECCLAQAEAVLQSFNQENTIIRLPYNNTVNCVGSFKNIPTANANTLSGNPKFHIFDYPTFATII